MSNPIITTAPAQTLCIENFGAVHLSNMPGDENAITIQHGLAVRPTYINVMYSDPNNAALAAAEVSVDEHEITIFNANTGIAGTVTIWWTAKFKM